MKINSYTKTTKSSLTLPKEFKEDVNMALISQAVHVYRNRSHSGTAKTQTRAEVTLRKGKWYKQKGTGNARHGAKSAPIFVGGGKAHGPTGVKKVLTLPKKMRSKALFSTLSYKAKKGDIAAFSAGKLSKTKDAQAIIEKIRSGEKSEKAKMTIVLSDKNAELRKAFKNIERVSVVRNSDLNAYTVFTANKLIFDKDIFKETK